MSGDGLEELIGFLGGMALGYAFLKALLQRRCPRCGQWTPRNDSYCQHCNVWIGRPPE